MSDIKYNNHFCAFIDILGYKDIIENVEKGLDDASSVIENIESIIQNGRRLACQSKYPKINISK
jgi:hypothetical protein